MAWAKKIGDFLQNAASVCLPFVPPTAAQLEKRLNGILKKIRKIPEGDELLRFLEENGVKIAFSQDITATALYQARLVPQDKEWKLEGKAHFIFFHPEEKD